MLSLSLIRYYAPLRLPIRPKMISLPYTPSLRFSFSPDRVSGTALTLLPQRAIPATPENPHDDIRWLVREIAAFPI